MWTTTTVTGSLCLPQQEFVDSEDNMKHAKKKTYLLFFTQVTH